jgi:hypothetical protein
MTTISHRIGANGLFGTPCPELMEHWQDLPFILKPRRISGSGIHKIAEDLIVPA